MNKSSKRTCEDVLNDFAVEEATNKITLTRYLRMYPEYAEDLVDLARELSRESNQRDRELSESDQTLIDNAWIQHKNVGPGRIANPLEGMEAGKRNEIIATLSIPRQVFAALRERRVVVSSIPKSFLNSLASMVGMSADTLSNVLAGPPDMNSVRSYKSDASPGVSEQVTFEQLLIDAGVTEQRRSALMRESD